MTAPQIIEDATVKNPVFNSYITKYKHVLKFWSTSQVMLQICKWFVVIVQSLSCDPMACSTPGFLSFTISQSLLKLMPIESVMPSSHLVHCGPILLPSGSFLTSQLFASGGQCIGASASAPVLPWWRMREMNIQGWFPLESIGLIFLLSKGLQRVFSSTTVQKH